MFLTSVVMVSYQSGPAQFRAIASVLAQTSPIELCVVDNGNPPDVVAKLRELARANDNIRFITGQGNVGFSKGCNIGAKAVQGDYLLFLNPDCILPPNAIEALMGHAVALPRPFMLGARLLDADGKDQRGCRRALLTPRTAFIEALHLHPLFPKIRLNFNDEPIPQAMTPMPAISGAFMFLPREDFWRVDGFDEGYFLHVEDLDLCLRFRRSGGEIYFVPDVVATHVGGSSSAPKAFVEWHKTRGFIRYFHKNFGDQYPAPLLWALDAAAWARAGVKIGVAKIGKGADANNH